jgi:hypothetical protein
MPVSVSSFFSKASSFEMASSSGFVVTEDVVDCEMRVLG